MINHPNNQVVHIEHLLCLRDWAKYVLLTGEPEWHGPSLHSSSKHGEAEWVTLKRKYRAFAIELIY